MNFGQRHFHKLNKVASQRLSTHLNNYSYSLPTGNIFPFFESEQHQQYGYRSFRTPVTWLFDFNVKNKRKHEQPTILFLCESSKSRYLVKLPRHDLELLSSHNYSPHWQVALSTLYLWKAYLELGKVNQKKSKSEIQIVKLNKSSTPVQRSLHIPVIGKSSIRVCGREWTHAKEMI